MKQKVDKLFVNGKIYTFIEENDTVEALAVDKGKIVWTGTTAEALEKFEGDFILQTMFLKSPDFDSASPEVLQGWMDIVRRLKPREVMVYTIDRPTPQQNLEAFTVDQMRQLVQPLIDEGFSIDIKGRQ